MPRQTDSAKAAAKAQQAQIETTDADQRAAHDDRPSVTKPPAPSKP